MKMNQIAVARRPDTSASLLGIRLPVMLDVSLLIRGITALCVIWWHTGGYLLSHPALAFFYVPGRTSVLVFFIISGYVISAGFERRRYSFDMQGLIRFYRNRLLRIYPLFLLVSGISLVILASRGQLPRIGPEWALRQLFMLQWYHNYDLVGVFWTLGVEVQFYMVASVLFWLQSTRSHRLWVPLVVYGALAAIPAVAHFLSGASWDNRTLLGNLAHFQAGLVVHRLIPISATLRWTASRRAITSGFALATGLVMASNWLYHWQGLYYWMGIGTLLVDVAGVITLVLHAHLERHSIGGSRIVAAGSVVGVLSYGLYAWHGFVGTYFPGFRGRFVPTLVASSLLAYASYRMAERPMLDLRRSSQQPQTGKAADGRDN